MYHVTLLYGHPQDPAAFEEYYYQKHLPLAAKISGVKGFTLSKLESGDPHQSAPYYRTASLYFDSREACQTVLATPEAQAAVADLQNFATGGVTVVEGEEEVLVPVSLASA